SAAGCCHVITGTHSPLKKPSFYLASLSPSRAVAAIEKLVCQLYPPKTPSSSVKELLRKGLRRILALPPLLGVTYILGYFIYFYIAVDYLYILVNSAQGVIFTIFTAFLTIRYSGIKLRIACATVDDHNDSVFS
ncbi:unnamed protein product, partial [Porites evermanni]